MRFTKVGENYRLLCARFVYERYIYGLSAYPRKDYCSNTFGILPDRHTEIGHILRAGLQNILAVSLCDDRTVFYTELMYVFGGAYRYYISVVELYHCKTVFMRDICRGI